jgi:hypothetical protein
MVFVWVIICPGTVPSGRGGRINVKIWEFTVILSQGDSGHTPNHTPKCVGFRFLHCGGDPRRVSSGSDQRKLH